MPEQDADVAQETARTGDDDIRHRGIEDILHLRIGREEVLQNRDHLVQLRRIGAEEAEQVPEKEETGCEREKKLIGHLRGEAGGVVRHRFPQETPGDSADEF